MLSLLSIESYVVQNMVYGEKEIDMAVRSTEEIVKAFNNDGYDVGKQVEYNGKRGFIGESRTAVNYETKEKKRVYYVEGSSHEMGYLMGFMAPEAVKRMANEFIDNLINSLIAPSLDKEYFDWLFKAIRVFLEAEAKRKYKEHPEDIPESFIEEMKGIVDGCKKVKRCCGVNFDKLLLLNMGIDILLSQLYVGFSRPGLLKDLKSKKGRFETRHLRIPISCNAFAIYGNGTKSKEDYYFGRDFMFANAGVFQDEACMTIYAFEDDKSNNNFLPFVAVSAPGFVGAIATINSKGIGMGVNIVPAAVSDSQRPGFNSLMLVRDSTQKGDNTENALKVLTEAQRGVSWIYYIADGKNNNAAIVEAGMKQNNIDFLSYVSNWDLILKRLLPDQAYLDSHQSQPLQDSGLMVRGNNYKYETSYLDFNGKLFKRYKKDYNEAMFSETGFIDKTYTDTNCPLTYYFAPQREEKDDLVLVTNMYIIPEMRITMMNSRTVFIAKFPAAEMQAKTTYDDFQWRYDTLNKTLLDGYGDFDLDSAQEAIDFLRPSGPYPEYYAKSPKSSNGKATQIEGSVSICDMKAKIMKSHFGYYTDEWIQVTLPNFVI